MAILEEVVHRKQLDRGYLQTSQVSDDSFRPQARGWVALGDAHWKDGRPDQAREAWQEGVTLFGEDPRLMARLAAEGGALEALVDSELDPGKRVDTDLSVLEPAP